MYTDQEKKEIDTLIKAKSAENDTGCIVWEGYIDKKKGCLVRYKHKYVNVRMFMLGLKNIQVTQTCNNNACIHLDHNIQTSKIPKKLEDIKKQALEILSSKCETQTNDKQCIFYTGNIDKEGYGHTTFFNKTWSVHRLSYFANSDLEKMPTKENAEKFLVRHLCGNRACIKKDHLELGTVKENCGDKVTTGTNQAGEKHHGAKITEEIATKIKHSKYPYEHKQYKTQKERAKLFNVSLYIVQDIDTGKTWTHIKDRDGKVTNSKQEQKNEKARIRGKKAKLKEWGKEEWKQAAKKLIDNSKLDKRINKYTGTKCRIWQNYINAKGYGTTNILGLDKKVHILACEIKYKRRANPKEVAMHLCGNNACCRVDHMEFGSQKQNMIHNVIHGKSRAKLNPNQVLEIRQYYKDRSKTIKELSAMYGVGTKTIGSIVRNELWTHI